MQVQDNKKMTKSLTVRAKRRQVAIASSVVVAGAMLWLLSAQRAHAADDPAASTAATAPTALLPTQDPCDGCNRPVAQAARPPAGAAMPQDLPRTPAPPPTFRLNDIRLNGAQTLSADELKSATQPYIGRDVALADLEALAKAITDLYRARGYFLATAVVPVQTVRDGVVEISVIEGKLGKVDVLVAPDAPISEARVRGFLAGLQPGQAVNAQSYERAMLLLSDQPGMRVGSGLQEGLTPGTSDLTVEVTPARRWAFQAEADNHGTEESGRYRVGGTVRWLSPFGIGDNLDARILLSNSNERQFGRLSYEAPLGTSGLRAGMGIARVNYELGGQFEPLDAHGVADVYDISLNYPLIRQRQQ
ncbi:MAG: POTRA domain-containing protein, partial [Hyphomicrobiaceae bacterium]